jgi:hypothetical protein
MSASASLMTESVLSITRQTNRCTSLVNDNVTICGHLPTNAPPAARKR